MKAYRTISAVFTIIFTAAMLAPAALARASDGPEQTGLGIARVSYMTGDVLFSGEEDDEWAEVTPNFPLKEGDRLWVGDDSKMEVRFETGETAWVNYQSELDMVSLERSGDGNAYQMGLPFGEASFDVGNFEVLGSVLQVDTPNASVRAYGRALFRVTSLSDGTTQVGVGEGSVEVESERGVANIHSDEMLEVYEDGRSRIMDLPPYDDWDEWVDARLDRHTRSYASTRYLPRGMYSYAEEFDAGGRWVSYPEYGYVWVPHVEVGWSPYSNGRWVWQGWHYVWLPYDPWYAPFHYGRWYWTVRFGWCWIPPVPTAVYWSPGYVGWVWDVDYVYWVPLAPGEIYYGYGYYGPTSVNIYKTTVIVNKNVYVNTKARNGVVAVKRDNFLGGRTVRVSDEKVVRRFKEKIVRKEVGRERIVREEDTFGAPPVNAIKAVKATRHPRPDKVFKAEKVSSRLVRPERFEKERKVVRGKVKSAFEPGKSPRHMKDLERINRPEFKRNGRATKQERRQETWPGRQERIKGGAAPDKGGAERKATRKEERIQRKELREKKRIERLPETAPREKPVKTREPDGGRWKGPGAQERGAAPSRQERTVPERGTGRPETAPRERGTRTREPEGGRTISPAAPQQRMAPSRQERAAPERGIGRPETAPSERQIRTREPQGGRTVSPAVPQRGVGPGQGQRQSETGAAGQSQGGRTQPDGKAAPEKKGADDKSGKKRTGDKSKGWDDPEDSGQAQ